MKKVRLYGDYVSDRSVVITTRLNPNKHLHCPVRSNYDEDAHCGDWCAWFDIESKTTIESQADFVASGYKEVKYKVITCKGTIIAELIEEENDKVSL